MLSSLRATGFAVALASLATLAVTTCGGEGVTKPTPPAYLTLTLDQVTGDNIDTPNWWDGVTLLIGADQSVNVLAVDMWNNRLRYNGCSGNCTDAAHWLQGTGDSLAFSYSVYSAGAVRTAAGIAAVYSAGDYAAPASVHYAHCAGACNLGSGWSVATLFPNAVSIDKGPGGNAHHDTPLATDDAGGLHLVYRGFQDTLLHYAHCAGACSSQASWQDVALDSSVSGLANSARLIAVAPGGSVHVLYATSRGLTHASCSASCGTAASWHYESVAGSTVAGFLRAISAAFGPDGRLHVAYGDQGHTVTYAVCSALCPFPGTWSLTTLPLATTDVGLAVDGGGTLYLATTGATVTVSRCAAACLSAAGWQSAVVDSALGGGQVAIATDATGRVRVASSYGAWPIVLQISQASSP